MTEKLNEFKTSQTVSNAHMPSRHSRKGIRRNAIRPTTPKSKRGSKSGSRAGSKGGSDRNKGDKEINI